MLGLIVDTISAADHKIMKPAGPPRESGAGAEVVSVGSKKRAVVRRILRRDETGEMDAVLTNVDDSVVVLNPALKVVIPHSQRNREVACGPPLIVRKVGL